MSPGVNLIHCSLCSTVSPQKPFPRVVSQCSGGPVSSRSAGAINNREGTRDTPRGEMSTLSCQLLGMTQDVFRFSVHAPSPLT